MHGLSVWTGWSHVQGSLHLTMMSHPTQNLSYRPPIPRHLQKSIPQPNLHSKSTPDFFFSATSLSQPFFWVFYSICMIFSLALWLALPPMKVAKFSQCQWKLNGEFGSGWTGDRPVNDRVCYCDGFNCISRSSRCITGKLVSSPRETVAGSKIIHLGWHYFVVVSNCSGSRLC